MKKKTKTIQIFKDFEIGYEFGWDVSSSYVGVCLLGDNNDPRWWHLDLTKIQDPYAKADEIEQFVESICGRFDHAAPQVHFIEDRLSGFSAGFSSAQTLMTLGAINFFTSWCLNKEAVASDGAVIKIHPSTVKAIMAKRGLLIPKGGDKKKLTLDFVTRLCPEFPLELNKNDKPKPYCYDMADATCVVLAGHIRHVEREEKDPDVDGGESSEI